MGSSDSESPEPSPRSYAFAAVPMLALTLGVPFANHVQPTILGLPFLLAYIVAWIFTTPLFMLAAYRSMRPRE